jgi:hypothetical protein
MSGPIRAVDGQAGLRGRELAVLARSDQGVAEALAEFRLLLFGGAETAGHGEQRRLHALQRGVRATGAVGPAGRLDADEEVGAGGVAVVRAPGTALPTRAASVSAGLEAAEVVVGEQHLLDPVVAGSRRTTYASPMSGRLLTISSAHFKPSQ